MSNAPDSAGPTDAPPERAPADENSDHQHNRQWLILAVIGIAQLMVVLDATIVNIALPNAMVDLGYAPNDPIRQWIVTAYALAFGSLLLLGGRLSDLFGRKIAFLIGLTGFAVSSAIGGAAVNLAMLVAARAGQGLFGALLAPAILAVLSTTFTDPADRGRAFGIFGALAGGGGAIGLLLGGVLTQYLDWRWCMYVNLVFAGISLVGALMLLPGHEQDGERPQLDVPGTLAASAGFFCIVFGFANAERYTWGSPMCWAFLVGGAVLLAVFVMLQSRVANPLLPLRVILDRNRGASYLAILVIGIGIFAIFLFLTFYLQVNLEFTPVITGLAFLPMVGALMTGTLSATSFLLPRLGPRPLIATGMTTAAVGLFWLSFIDINSSYPANVLPAMVVSGLGIGLAMSPAMQTAIFGVEPTDAGVASASVNTMQQIGGSIGTALLSSIAASAAASYLADQAAGEGSRAAAQVYSYTVAFTWGAGIFLAGAVICGFLLRSGTLQAAGAEEAEAPTTPTPIIQLVQLGSAWPYATPERPLYLYAQQARRAPVQLRPAVLGYVRAADGSAVPDATITLIDAKGRQMARDRSVRNGSYRLEARQAGKYVLICTAPPNQPTAERITLGADALTHDIVLSAQSGQIRTGTG